MRMLFRQNRMISSIAAELDQKSCWEVLTDPQFTQKYFSADERQVFRRHILWTRILSDRHDAAARRPAGRPARVRRAPSTRRWCSSRTARYGGEGVVIGPALTRRRSGRRPSTRRWPTPSAGWCSSWRASRCGEFPVVGPDGRVHVEPFYTVMGFAADAVRPGDPGPGLAEAGGQRRPARRAVRGDGGPLPPADRGGNRVRSKGS